MLTITQKTDMLRQEAIRLGFSDIGFSKATKLKEEATQLSKWLENGRHAGMGYMENHFDKRTDPRELVPGAKSVISLLFNYFTSEQQKDPDAPIVSKYAYGRDYHKEVKKSLKHLFKFAQENLGVEKGRFFVDSGPVLERAWAKKSGLGWIGKNTMLISPKRGSYFFLSELIVDVDFIYDSPIDDHCGRCRKCIDACPTSAIDLDGYSLDGGKCISYLTIENKELIPEEYGDQMSNRVFGCDICMEVCPWNKFSKEHETEAFKPKEAFLSLSKDEWEKLDEQQYEKLFNGTPVRRAKFSALRRNIDFLQ